ncbi:MAG: hypothetical protein AAF563_14905 [Pseudomonadota bacterium]
MRFLISMVVVVAALVVVAYFGLRSIGLIGESCPPLDDDGFQVMIENRLLFALRANVHEATTNELRIGPEQCVAVDVNSVRVTVETWAFDETGTPNCTAELRPANRLTIFERGGNVYCEVGEAR